MLLCSSFLDVLFQQTNLRIFYSPQKTHQSWCAGDVDEHFFLIDNEVKLDKSSHVWWLENCAAGIQKIKLITLPVINYALEQKVGNYRALELELESFRR